MNGERILRWRRIDEPGIELCRISSSSDGIVARSQIVHAGAQPFGLRYVWELDPAWRTRRVTIELPDGPHRLTIERSESASWRIDGVRRPDLDGCAEVDLSVTPFCNALALRRLGDRPGELTALYVAAPGLKLAPSRQRYERRDGQWWYVDLGAARGFEAELRFDTDGMVENYQGLFEAIGAAGAKNVQTRPSRAS